MRKISLTVSLAVAAGITFLGSVLFAGEMFEFRYEPDRPLNYAMAVGMDMDMDLKIMGQVINSKMNFEMRLNLKLTAEGAPVDGVTTLLMNPSKIEGDWVISDPSGGKMVINLRNSEVKGLHNGVLVIDTKNNVGMDIARELKKEITPLYLSGKVDVDAQGNIKQFHGDLPFVDFWSSQLEEQVGLFGIVFPEGPVASDGSWKEEVSFSEMGEIKIKGEALKSDVQFTRGADVTEDGRELAVFSLAAPFTYKNLKGSMTQGLHSIELDIPNFERTADGTIHFDKERGVISKSLTTVDATAEMQAREGAETMGMDMRIKAEISFNLLPEE